MANEERISSIVDINSIKKELDYLNTNLDEIAAKIKTIPVIKTKMDGTESVKEYSKAQVQLAESFKAVDSLIKQRFASEAKLVTLQTDYAKATATSRLEIQKTNKELKDAAAYRNAETGSIEKARAAVSLLNTERNKLNLYTEEGRARQEKLNTQIDKYNAFIKKSVDSLSQQKINIGNYSGAINILKGTLDEVTKKIEQNTKAGKGNTDVVKALRKEQDILNNLVKSQAAGFAKGAIEVRANEKALLDLSRAGLQASKSYKDLALATGKLKDDLADVKARTKALGSDTFVFDGLISGAQTLAGAYGVAQGAAALFGKENEDMQKTFVKLQAVMTVIQGLQSIANGLQKENAAILLLQQVREKAVLGIQVLKNFVLRGSLTATRASTVATQANTAATGANAVATRAATAATIGFRAALISTGIGAILVLLASAASAISDFGDETADATQDIDAFNRRLEFNKELLDGQIESLKFAGQIQGERAKQRGANDAELTKLEIDNLNRIKDTYLANAKIRQGEFDKEISKTKGFNKDKSTALAKEIEENKKAALLIGNEITLKTEQAKTKAAEKGFQDRKKLSDEAAKRALENAEKDRKAQFQILKDSAQERVDLLKKQVDDESQPLQKRLNALVEYNNQVQSILTAQKNFDIANTKLTAKEKEAIINKFRIDTRAQAAAFEAENLQILKTAKKKEVEEYKKSVQDIQAEIEKLNDTADFKNNQSRNKELLQAVKDFASGIIKSTEELNKKEQEINDKYNKIEFDNEVKKQLQILLIKKAAGFDVEEQLKSLQDLKDQADKNEIEKAKKTAEELGEIEKDKALLRKQLFQEAQETLLAFLDASIEKEVQLLDERKRLLDEDTARRINNINLLGLSEVERVKKTAEVEKNAQFQTEQIEKRKRQLAVQRAQFDKAASIAAIIQNTAEAISKQIAKTPLPAGLPLVAIIAGIGALQLARAVATPLPRYKGGRGKGKDELAITGDGGKREPIVRADGTIELSPARSTLTHLAKNDMVFPDINSLMMAMHQKEIKAFPKMLHTSDPELKSQIRELISVTKKAKANVQVHNHMPIETTAWYQNNIKN